MSSVLAPTLSIPAEEQGYELLVGLIPKFARILGAIKFMRISQLETYATEFGKALADLDPETLDQLAELLEKRPEGRLAIDSLHAFRARSRRRLPSPPHFENEVPQRHCGQLGPSHTEVIEEKELDLIENNIIDLFQLIVDVRLG